MSKPRIHAEKAHVLTMLRQNGTRAGTAALKAGGYFLAGLLASRGVIFGSCAPFGLAAIAVVPGGNSLFVLLGAVLGYLLPYGSPGGMRYLAAAGALLLIKWLASSFEDLYSHAAFAPVAAAAITFITGMAVVINTGMATLDLMLCFAETVLCGCAAYFMQGTLKVLRRPSGLWGLPQHELAGLTICCCILLLPLSGVSYNGVSLGRVIGIFAILVAAHYGREAGGSVTGIAVGVVMSLADKSMAQVMAGYAIAGLVAGLFSPLGRFGCSVAFILANGVTALYLAQTPAAIADFYEVLIATVLFMVIPERLLCRFSVFFVPAGEGSAASHVKQAVSKRLLVASNALEDVAHTVSELTKKLRRVAKKEAPADIYTQAADITCKRCGMKMFCWETAYNDTMDSFNAMTDTLQRKGRVERDDVPSHFAGRCCKLGDMLGSINKCYGQQLTRQNEQRKSDHLRVMLAEEFSSISSLLKDLAGEYIEDVPRSEVSGERVREALLAFNLNVSDLFCRIDGRGRLTIRADVSRSGRAEINREELADRVSLACGRRMEGPSLSGDGNILSLEFTEKPEYRAAFGTAIIRKTGERLCGDAGRSFIDSAGNAVMILSDGMGCGGRAAVDSNMAVELMTRLMDAGFGYEPAVRVVNSALMLKSGEESFATLDIASVDLYSGSARFIKAGAAPTYLRRSGRAERISPSSLPVGILSSVKVEKAVTNLRRGDLAVILSDGALGQEDDWLIKEIESFDGDPKELAKKLATRAKRERDDGHDDDITVMAVQLS